MPSLARSQVLLAALLMAACSSASNPPGTTPDPQEGGSGGDGGSGGGGTGGSTGGKGGAPMAGNGGSGGTGGATLTPDAAVAVAQDAGTTPSPDVATATPDATAGAGGSTGAKKALLVVGAIPIIGSDIQIHERLVAKGVEVQDIRDTASSAASAMGKDLVIISYSIDSEFVTGKFNDVSAAVVVMEQNLLGSLGMTANSAAGHGWSKPGTTITMLMTDSPLGAGLTGDVTVAQNGGSVFWGVPSAEAIKVATLKGNAGRISLFAYEAGAMMVGKKAPGRRLQFFLGAHLEPVKYLSPDGIKLLDATIDWCIR